jgi:Xaa-Pro aminopeptidase
MPLLVPLLWLLAQSTASYQADFPPEEFQVRWNKVFDRIGPEAVAVVQGVSLTSGFTVPRQSNEFYYLSGIETPHSYLLLDGRRRQVTLYLPPRNARLESAEGKVLSAEDAALVKTLTGAGDVLSAEALRDDWLAKTAGGAPRVIYALFTPAEGNAQSRHELLAANAAIASDPWDGRLPREARFVELLRTRYPLAKIEDLTPILDELRGVKSPREIALLRRAGDLAARGIVAAMQATRPGGYEYQLDAAARYVYLVNGARLEGYRSITAAGTANIWNGHYYRNTARLNDGDLVLMDYAPEVGYYTSDIGRMWPVNGKYSLQQRELVGFVLAYHSAVLERIRPGLTARQIMDDARQAMEPVFAQTKFSKPIYEQAARRLVNTGGGVFSHPVGMAVHDDGEYVRGPLKPGHVISIDPQLRVPEENLYIRYEDTIAVTETGIEILTSAAPTKLEDLEKLVGQARTPSAPSAR